MLAHTDYGRGANGVARHQRTQRPLVENVRAVLDSDQTQNLLLALCVKFGFCLPPNQQDRIISEPPLTVFDFTDAVFASEGLDPAALCWFRWLVFCGSRLLALCRFADVLNIGKIAGAS
jgi:hypothetical protein